MRLHVLFLLVPALLLAACDSAPATTSTTVVSTFYGDTRTDEQGAVSVTVTPLVRSGETLEFDVAMNTHSVDLSMDLAALATLSNDMGQFVTPMLWDAPRSGHHVAGRLIFPANVDGVLLLDGTKQITLTIRDVVVPERVFVWRLVPD